MIPSSMQENEPRPEPETAQAHGDPPRKSGEASSRPPRILEVGRNCWRRERAERIAFLVDGADYFDAVAAALEQARRQVLIVGWDVHSRVALRREPDGSGQDELAALLDRCVRESPELEVHVLAWDFAMIYAGERETLPLLRFGLRTHGRVHFHLDDRHPVGASHHQKIVVVDDSIAFCGGLDLTQGRWDTSEHRPADPRRRQPGGRAYGPFHDVQMAVDGDAAAALGDLARQRWQRATHETLEAPRVDEASPVDADPWPDTLEPALRDADVGIARTQGAFGEAREIREVERLLLDACAAAQETIYIETQYLTAARIGHALEERLREPEGPEIVVVTRKGWSGWLEETTMSLLRARLVARLRDADEHDRLRILYPMAADMPDEGIKLHSKLAIVDDRLVRVGSANLANRSMGLDSECDLAIEAASDAHAEAILGLRDRLVGEHLGLSPARVREECSRRGSLVAAIDALRDGPRTLAPLPVQVPGWVNGFEEELNILDPEHPIEFERLREQFLPEEELARPAGLRMVMAAGVSALIVLAAAAWHLTPLAEWTTLERLTDLGSVLQKSPTGLLMGLSFFVIASNLVPVTVLVAASALVFGWQLGFLVGMTGSVVSSALGYGVGALLWRDTVRLLAGRHLNRLGERLEQRGLLFAIAVRVIPVAPFPVVNLVAGASRIRLRDFLLGTALGMAPGMLMLTLFAEGAWTAFQDPRPERILLLVAIVMVFAVTALALRRSTAHSSDSSASDPEASDPEEERGDGDRDKRNVSDA